MYYDYRRTPFIWTPRQPKLHRGPADFFPTEQRDEGVNRWLMFRRSFALPDAPASAPTRVTVDGRYKLWINGTFVGRGPSRSSNHALRVDEWDIAPYLRAGENIVAVLVHCYGVATSFHEMVDGLQGAVFGEGGLFFDGAGVAGDAQWRCRIADGWDRDAPRMNFSLGFAELLDGRVDPPDWTSLGFDDSAWDRAEIMVDGVDPASPFGQFHMRPFPILEPRGIPPLEERFAAPVATAWTRGHVPDTSLPVERRAYEEVLVKLSDMAVSGDVLSGTTVTTGTADIGLMLDFGRIVTGHPLIAIDAKGGEIIEIACGERIEGEWTGDGPLPFARLHRGSKRRPEAMVVRYIARPGRQEFEGFENVAIRWMHIVVRNAPAGLRIERIGATLANYPVEERGAFASSDPLLARLWQVGAYTLRQCMHDAWEDCPGREQRQWLGDATVENLVGHAAFGPCIAPLNAKYLVQAAESQRRDGLTEMFAPGDPGTFGLPIPDWTLQWILNAADHYQLTGDLDTIERIFPSIQKALGWFAAQCAPSGLVADVPYWHFHDWAALGRHGESATLNGLYAGALRAAAGLADALGIPRARDRYAAEARSIGMALDARHWDERRGVWVDMVDPSTEEQSPLVSQHATAAIVLWTDPPADRAARALDYVCDPARLRFTAAPPIVPTGETVNHETDVVLANSFFAHFLFEALAKHGRMDAVLDLIRARFGPMLNAGATTLWESFAPSASLCHAFSATAVHQFTRHLLGIQPTEPAFERMRWSPHLGNLSHANGIVPTAQGDVAVELYRNGDVIIASAVGEAVQRIEPVAAPGYRLLSIDRLDPLTLRAHFATDCDGADLRGSIGGEAIDD